MLHQGFHDQEYKKAVYFVGHKCPNVVDYWQNEFLPEMAKRHIRLVENEVGNVSEEVGKIITTRDQEIYSVVS